MDRDKNIYYDLLRQSKSRQVTFGEAINDEINYFSKILKTNPYSNNGDVIRKKIDLLKRLRDGEVMKDEFLKLWGQVES